jgi:hypothetical protein
VAPDAEISHTGWTISFEYLQNLVGQAVRLGIALHPDRLELIEVDVFELCPWRILVTRLLSAISEVEICRHGLLASLC